MKISKKAKTRILRLCDYMESLPASANKHFHMGTFFSHDGDHAHEFSNPDALTVKDLHACGTSACALGWAATMPYFRRLGLKLSADVEDVSGDETEIFDFHNCEADEDYGMWGQLFGANNRDKTPKAWAKRVRRLVEWWSQERRAT